MAWDCWKEIAKTAFVDCVCVGVPVLRCTQVSAQVRESEKKNAHEDRYGWMKMKMCIVVCTVAYV